ncbi:hypothetical protein EVAR_97032_1 [Eumeta japonica]|uniref:Proton-coupled folate transporter n=1 Tax=Eumeta variegata TaxID=151549 RepID=A0A4C1WNR0_EUMVA|nr:hypothetical protein EVAR_97032_1 [Eumeta japonica]
MERSVKVALENPMLTKLMITVSTFTQWNGVATHIVPLVLAFFLGSWSDKRGRKIILLGGLLGKLYFSLMITYITTNGNARMPQFVPNLTIDWPLEYVIYAAAFPSALTGADLAIFAGAFAYLADVTSAENRTLRVGILDVVYLSTMPTGVALGSLFYNKFVNKSFTAMFAINSSLMVIATAYTCIFLKWQTRPEQKSFREAGVKNPIADFFDFKNIKQTFITLSKKRPSNRRVFLWFLLLSMALYTFQRDLVVSDERPVMYLYTTLVFQWDATDFSNFRTFLSTAYVLCMLVGIPLMTKVLKWKDTVILMLGATAHMSGHFIYSQAKAPYMFYVGGAAAALGPCVAPLIRSMTSKVLAPSERGVAYAFLSVMENLVAMFASIIYSQLYKATLDTAHVNAIFLLTMGTQAVVFLFALIMEIMLKGKKLESIIEVEEKNINEDISL